MHLNKLLVCAKISAQEARTASNCPRMFLSCSSVQSRLYRSKTLIELIIEHFNFLKKPCRERQDFLKIVENFSDKPKTHSIRRHATRRSDRRSTKSTSIPDLHDTTFVRCTTELCRQVPSI